MSNTTDIHIAEFNTLRQEIMQDRTFIKDYRSLAFSSTIAVLAFSFSDFASKEPFICLLPILIAIPLSLLCNKCYKSIAKLAAYLYVFYEFLMVLALRAQMAAIGMLRKNPTTKFCIMKVNAH